MPMLRTIERPTKATLRPWSWAASRTCWMRCTWLAKLDTMTRRGAVRKTCSMAGVRSRSDGGEAGDLGVGGVGEEEVDALLAQPGEAAQVGDPAVQRELVHLEVAGVQHQAGGGADRDGQAVGDRVVDRDELAVERARAPAGCPSRDLDGLRGDPVLLELGLDEGQRELGADQGDVRPLAQQVRHAADVVLVPVREHDGVDLVEAVPDPGEVGQDHVDTRAGAPRGRAPRSRRSAACRRARRRSCCGRSPPARPAARRAGRPQAAGRVRPCASNRAGSSRHAPEDPGGARAAFGMLLCAHSQPSVVSVVGTSVQTVLRDYAGCGRRGRPRSRLASAAGGRGRGCADGRRAHPCTLRRMSAGARRVGRR